MSTPRPASGPPPQVLQWLHRVIAPEYQDPQRTYTDVATALGALPSLSPRTSVYTHENGQSELLVQLLGTLPVIFRGSTYNIPISIWVPHQYPGQPPIAFITPAKDMMIRPGNHVDLAGRCYHPYLANWIHYSDRSNIVDLCDVLRGVFSRDPPVTAKQQAPPQHEPAAPPPRPPLPPELATPTPPPATSPPPQGPPPVPPLPKELTGVKNGSPDPRRPPQGPPPPPPPPSIPPHAYQQQQQQQQPHQTPPPGSYYDGSPNNGRNPPIPLTQHQGGSSPLQPHPGPQQSYHPTGSPQQPVHARSPPPQPRFPIAQPPRPVSFQGPPPPGLPRSPVNHSSSNPQPKPQFLDLLDSPSPSLPTSPQAESAPPVPPPNPEKDLIIGRIADALHSIAATAISRTEESLSATSAQHSSLLRAQSQLENERAELLRIGQVCDADSEILRERIAMAERVIDECHAREPPNVDQVVVAPSVVENQLYDLVTEDLGIEDTIYALAKALDGEKITLEAFLKHARSLAREQFLKRALARKITDEMGITVGEQQQAYR